MEIISCDNKVGFMSSSPSVSTLGVAPLTPPLFNVKAEGVRESGSSDDGNEIEDIRVVEVFSTPGRLCASLSVGDFL